MTHKYAITYRKAIFDQTRARAIHKVLGFGPNNKYEGRYAVEVSEGEHAYTVSARSEKTIREFKFASNGETSFKETRIGQGLKGANIEIETIYSGQDWIRKKLDYGQSKVGNPNVRRLMDRDLEDERAWHYWLSNDLKELLRPVIVGENRLHQIEPEAGRFRFGTNPAKISQADFFKNFDGLIRDFRPFY